MAMFSHEECEKEEGRYHGTPETITVWAEKAFGLFFR
jgi:hypothetical protein